MKPAGASKVFAYFFVLAMAIQPLMSFSMPNTSYREIDPGNSEEQSFYTISLNSSTNSKVVLASRQGVLSAPKLSSDDVRVSVADFNDFYQELKVIALDFSRVKISVVNRQTREAVLKVLPVSVLFYIAATVKAPFDLKVSGVMVVPVAVDRLKEKDSGPPEGEFTHLVLQSETSEDLSSQSTLVLRC